MLISELATEEGVGMGSCVCCRVFLAVLLILLNLLGLCLGVLLVVACSVLLSTMNGFGLFTAGIESPLILGIIAGIFLVLLSALAILGALLTCLGGNPVVRWVATILLVGYMVVMVALIVLEIGATVALAVLRREIVETAGEWYTSQIQEQANQEGYLENIDRFQRQLDCCGFMGPEDYRNTSLGLMGKLPNSCCMPNLTTVATMYNSTCAFNSSSLITTGCRSQLEMYVDTNIVPLSVAWGVLIVVEVACAVIPVLLIVAMFMTARRDGYEKA